MKLINITKLFSVFILMLIVASSCSKNASYISGGSLHNAETDLTTYDYLASNSWKLFDTLLLVIDRLNLKEEINSAGTFFAPTDYSILAYMLQRQAEKRMFNENAVYSLDSLYSELRADSVRQYLFDEKLTLADASIDPQPVTSKAGTTKAVYKQLQSSFEYTEWTSGETYLLYFRKVRGALDLPGSNPPPLEIDINVLCQTTGIQTQSNKAGGGTIINVLNNFHNFVRF